MRKLKLKEPKPGFELHPDDCSHDFDDCPECCICGCSAYDYEQKLMEQVEKLKKDAEVQKKQNGSLKRMLRLALSAMAKGGEADDDMPSGQECRYCHRAIHWPAVAAGYGGHKKSCPYDRIKKFCQRIGM